MAIIGGSTRIPAVQKALREFLGRDELGQGLNGDEAAAMGAVFRAANLSTAFQVRKFGMVDVNPFSVGVRLTDLPKGARHAWCTLTDDCADFMRLLCAQLAKPWLRMTNVRALCFETVLG